MIFVGFYADFLVWLYLSMDFIDSVHQLVSPTMPAHCGHVRKQNS